MMASVLSDITLMGIPLISMVFLINQLIYTVLPVHIVTLTSVRRNSTLEWMTIYLEHPSLAEKATHFTVSAPHAASWFLVIPYIFALA